jgi:hypothetical protein
MTTTVILFTSSDGIEYGQKSLSNITPINEITKSLIESTSITMIREPEPGIPGVIRKNLNTDSYGGVNLIGNENTTKELNFKQDEIDSEESKKVMMEAKEIEFRQERNLEELKRIGIFMHTMATKNKDCEKRMRQIEVELKSVENLMEGIREKLDMPKLIEC